LLDQEHGVTASGAPEEALQADVLSAAYGATIQVAVHPLTGTPLVHAVVQGEHAP
jgi:ABC-type hemin transport system ATPase subunit